MSNRFWCTKAFHTHPIDQIAPKHHVQQIIPEILERLPYHYQVKVERIFIIIESMITVAVIALAQYHAIHSTVVNKIQSNQNHNRSISNSNNITIHHHPQHVPVHRQNQYYTLANAITHQRALPIASFPMTCKIGCHPSKNSEVRRKRPSHHRHEYHRLHD